MKLLRHFIPVRVVFGRRTIQKVAEETAYLKLPTERVAVVCGKSAVNNRYVDALKGQFSGAFKVFDLVEPDPTVENAELIAKEVASFSPTIIVAVGGGSSIDVAKAVSVAITNKGRLSEFVGVYEPFENPGVPVVAVPTTSGSGSEVTPYAVLTDRRKFRKAPLISKYLYPVLAIDDPELTVTMSPVVTANTGVDALTHAVEAFVSKKSTQISRLFSMKATGLIVKYLPRAYGNPKDMEAREFMLLASMLAGMAIADAGAGLVHTMAHVLGVMYRIPHGLANGVFLVPVLEFYGLSIKEELKELALVAGFEGDFECILKQLSGFLSYLGIPNRLREVGLTESDIPDFINLVMEKKHLMGNLPRIPRERDLREMLEKNL